ncbi:MAG: hypothetical protein SNH88_06705 [Rikenellaceae bacterium]
MGTLPPYEMIDYSAPISFVSNYIQQEYPIVATILGMVLIIYSARRVSNAAHRMHLYERSNNLPFIMMVITTLSILSSQYYLTTALTATFATAALDLTLSSYQNSNQNDTLFGAGFTLGLLPLLYPPAIILMPMMVLTIVLFSRTLRESIIYTIGIIIPFTALMYINWLAGFKVITLIDGFIFTITHEIGFYIKSIDNYITWALISLFALLILLSVVFMGQITDRRRAKFRLFYIFIWLGVALFSLHIGASNSTFIAIAAPAAATLMPITLLSIDEKYSKYVYYLVLILALLGVVM